jgi:adenine-specific DNA-methyltransferase
MQKASGSYYTPETLADFVVEQAALNISTQAGIHILEPSCGDGAFVKSVLKKFSDRELQIDAIEISAKAVKAARAATEKVKSVKYTKGDFLFFQSTRTYDLVVGNPPFIKKKLLKKKQITQCESIHSSAGLKDRAINNIWTSFLIKSVSLLSSDGVLAFVLPAELLQVNFAQEIQAYLQLHFKRVEVFTFKKIVFPNIGQDTVALIARKSSKLPDGVYFAEVNELSESKSINAALVQSKSAERNDIKWSGHIISEDEIDFLLNTCANVKPISHYCSSVAGIVTGANGFFIVSKDACAKYGFEDICRPIIQRGQYVNVNVLFDKGAFDEIVKGGKPCYLLDFSNRLTKSFSSGERAYIKLGKHLEINERYKCSIRDRWYDVPSLWTSEAFFFKRCHLYPKLLKNSANVYVTDSAYRIRVAKGYDVNSFVYSFYNSLTLALSELKGRYYGGGVLELTPNEFKSVALPYCEITPAAFQAFASSFKTAQNIDFVLEKNDKVVLEKGLGLKTSDVARIENIRKKLLRRRLRSK